MVWVAWAELRRRPVDCEGEEELERRRFPAAGVAVAPGEYRGCDMELRRVAGRPGRQAVVAALPSGAEEGEPVAGERSRSWPSGYRGRGAV